MRILGIDTSSQKGSIAITLENKIVSEKSISDQTSYSRNLFLLVNSILQESDLHISKIDAFAVSIGPGSFTGLRVGLSTALGFSLAQNKPVISIDTLLAMAHTTTPANHLICPVLDARKGEVYASFFRYGSDGQISRTTEDRAMSPELLIEEVDQPTLFFGTGVDAYGNDFKQKLGNLAVFDSDFSCTTAASVAKLAFEKIENGEVTNSARLKPKYIRRSEAEMSLN